MNCFFCRVLFLLNWTISICEFNSFDFTLTILLAGIGDTIAGRLSLTTCRIVHWANQVIFKFCWNSVGGQCPLLTFSMPNQFTIDPQKCVLDYVLVFEVQIANTTIFQRERFVFCFGIFCIQVFLVSSYQLLHVEQETNDIFYIVLIDNLICSRRESIQALRRPYVVIVLQNANQCSIQLVSSAALLQVKREILYFTVF